jgi:peptide/nickel transport system permease protein
VCLWVSSPVTSGGVIDDVIMRVTDIVLGGLPALLLALALSSVLTPTIGSTIAAISVTWWPWYARLVRGEAASIRGRRYIESCQALGIPRWRILWRHVLPRRHDTRTGADVPRLRHRDPDGVGSVVPRPRRPRPFPRLGLMVSEGQAYFLTNWWLVTFPAWQF